MGCKVERRNESSNFQEADNLVMKIEALVETRHIKDHKVLLSTEKSTFELTNCQECSSLWKLSGIILCFYQVVQGGDLILCVIHVANTCMKAWGVDGMLRGACWT